MYIIIYLPGTSQAYVETNSHGFVLQFSSYEDAKSHAKIEDIEFEIYGECTDERNHII